MDQTVIPLASALPADVPGSSLRSNWWIVIPIAALVLAIRSHIVWFLNHVHVRPVRGA